MENIKSKTSISTPNVFLKKTFLVAGIGFLAVCLIGVIVNFIIDGSGVIKEEINGAGRLNMNIYKDISRTGAYTRLARFSMAAIVLILISSVLNIVWAFRALRASRAFIYGTFSTYVIAQGTGFGMLFVTWQAIDLIAVFGIAGGIFLVMAVIGYTSKNLLPLGKWLIYGSMIAFAIMIVSMVMHFAGVFSNSLNVILYSLMGFLTIGWIAYDVWSIKKTSQYRDMVNGFDEDMEFRLVMWSAFKLLSDLIALIWIIARFYGRNSN